MPMFSSMPMTVQEVLGEPAVRDLTVWLEALVVEKAVDRDAFGQVVMRMDGLDTRMGALEMRMDGLDTRMGALETRMTNVETRLTIVEHDLSEVKADLREFRRDTLERFDRLEAVIDGRFDRMNERFDQLYDRMNVQMRWTVGLLGIFGTLITILLGISVLAR
jgi:hypothetical protein